MKTETEATEMDIMDELNSMLDGVPEGIIADQVLADLSGDMPSIDVPAEEPTGYVIDKSAFYADQDNKVGVASDDEAAPVTADERKKRKRAGKKAKATETVVEPEPTPEPAGTEIVTRTGRLPPAANKIEALTRKASPADLSKFGYSGSEIVVMMDAMNDAPKKVGEKAYNLLRFVLGRETLSNFTKLTIRQLAATPDGMTVPELVKFFETGGTTHTAYQPGTARSQAQQQSKLLTIYGMVDKTSGKMVLNAEHPFVKELLSRL